ncbi:MAG: DUF2950 family protein [Planctomycetota bacterium]|nr:DUF2950 family protein [Planctomycetota bacterium]
MFTRLGKPAFTLIEIMIVLTIIALLASIAVPNAIRSKMAANEVAAVAACKIFCEAQSLYYKSDWDGDGLLEYATSLRGDYSLYELTAGSGDLSLVDKSMAFAEGDADTAIPKTGYIFRVLTGQGPDSPGGSKSYVQSGNLIGGYGLSAIPLSYDTTGRNTFQIGVPGVVYQRDRGRNDAAHLTAYGPDTVWTVP